jgi:hypothetical protein
VLLFFISHCIESIHIPLSLYVHFGEFLVAVGSRIGGDLEDHSHLGVGQDVDVVKLGSKLQFRDILSRTCIARVTKRGYSCHILSQTFVVFECIPMEQQVSLVQALSSCTKNLFGIQASGRHQWVDEHDDDLLCDVLETLNGSRNNAAHDLSGFLSAVAEKEPVAVAAEKMESAPVSAMSSHKTQE